MRFLAVAAVILLQGRFGWEMYESRQGFLYQPVELLPPSNEIRGRLRGELLAVNGRPFTGATVYYQELRRADRERYRPLPLKIRSKGEVRVVPAPFANCTCGSLNDSEEFWYILLPPALCVLVGAGVLLYRPRGWLFFAAAICMAQTALVPDAFGNFTQNADPREWFDWMRVPVVSYQAFFGSSWPAWFLLLVKRGAMAAWVATTPLLALGVLRTVLAVGWSENYALIQGLWSWTEAWETPLLAGALGAAGVLLGWPRGGWRRWLAMAFVAGAMAALYWTTAPPEFGHHWNHYSDNTVRWEMVLPPSYLTPGVVTACFTLVLAVIVGGGPHGWLVALLGLPLLGAELMMVDWWWVERFWWNVFLLGMYVGLAGLAWDLVVKRPPPADRRTGAAVGGSLLDGGDRAGV